MVTHANRHGQSGFTLLELLFVICILAILCGLAVARLNVKETTSSAWSAVRESAYQAAKGALTKALAQDPDNPPSLQDIARRVDTKREVYITDCDIAATSTQPTPANAILCLAIDVDGDRTSASGEVFAAAYRDGDCTTGVSSATADSVCCLERPFFDTTFPDPVPVVPSAGQQF